MDAHSIWHTAARIFRAPLPYKSHLLCLLFVAFSAFSIIPVNIGIGMTIVLSSSFHIRRLKTYLLSAGIVAVLLFVTLVRIFKPERFVNPELFANLTLFISEMKTPSYILLPNRWLSESLFTFLGKSFSSNTLIFISLLCLTSYLSTVFLQILFNKVSLPGVGALAGRRYHPQKAKASGFADCTCCKGDYPFKTF